MIAICNFMTFIFLWIVCVFVLAVATNGKLKVIYIVIMIYGAAAGVLSLGIADLLFPLT